MCTVRFTMSILATACGLRVANILLGLGSTPSAPSRRRVSPVPDRLARRAPRRPSYYASNWIKPILSSKNFYQHCHTKFLKSLQAPSEL